MRYNKITLAFPDEMEERFLKNYFLNSLFQVRFSFVLFIILYGLFGYLDWIMFPEYAKTFNTIRYVYVIPPLIGVWLFSFTKYFYKFWQELLVMSYLIGAMGIGVMIMLVPDNYSYYSGMMLVFMAGYFVVKLRFLKATIAGFAILIFFNLGVFLFTEAPKSMVITTNFFFISANIIGMIGAYILELNARRNYNLNYQLDKEKFAIEAINKNLEKIVDERTIELQIAKETAETTSANLTAIIEGTRENIWAFNRDYEILYINQVFQHEFQQTFGVWLAPGVNLINALPEPLRLFWKPRYDRVLNNEQFTVEDAIETEKGTIYIQVTFNPIAKKGKVVGGSCFGSNITYRKRAEMELIKAKERAEESDRLKSAFLANMSHEIRTPMNGILGFSELLKNPELNGDKQEEYINIIEKSGERMLNIINDIIDISKIEAGLMTINIQESNINEQLRYIHTFFKPETESKGIMFSVNLQLPENETVIKTDREKLYAILTNLVKNAIKYTNQGEIELGYIKKDNMLEFFVKDTGIGIPKDRQVAVFERFVQVDIENRMAYQGAGLGLSITKSLVEMMGGNIRVESEEGVGSRFYFTLPFNGLNRV